MSELSKLREELRKRRGVQREIQNLGLRIVDTDPWIPVKVLGEEFKFELSFGAVKDVFQRTGFTVGLDEFTASDLENMDLFWAMLLAGLRTHNQDRFGGVYEDAMSDLMCSIPIKHLQYYRTCIGLAVQATQPDPEEIEDLMATLRPSEVETPAAPLAHDDTSQGSGPDVEILEFPNQT